MCKSTAKQAFYNMRGHYDLVAGIRVFHGICTASGGSHTQVGLADDLKMILL